METSFRADRAGKIKSVGVAKGEVIPMGRMLVEFVVDQEGTDT